MTEISADYSVDQNGGIKAIPNIWFFGRTTLIS